MRGFTHPKNLAITSRCGTTAKAAPYYNVTTKIEMKIDDLKKLTYSCRYTLYVALLNMVKSKEGTGFHNHDKGHLVYLAGAKDGSFDQEQWGDSPKQNSLFQMMSALSDSLLDSDEFRREDLVNDWQVFCKLAIEADKEHRDSD